jgi:hypothetical protein
VVRLAPWLLITAGLLLYANSLSNPFVFDDEGSIVNNRDIRRLWPPTWAYSSTEEHAPTNHRPVVSFTLALNYALGGLDVRGYRAVNIAVHDIRDSSYLTGVGFSGLTARHCSGASVPASRAKRRVK